MGGIKEISLTKGQEYTVDEIIQMVVEEFKKGEANSMFAWDNFSIELGLSNGSSLTEFQGGFWEFHKNQNYNKLYLLTRNKIKNDDQKPSDMSIDSDKCVDVNNYNNEKCEELLPPKKKKCVFEDSSSQDLFDSTAAKKTFKEAANIELHLKVLKNMNQITMRILHFIPHSNISTCIY